jgi:hypothetical protein
MYVLFIITLKRLFSMHIPPDTRFQARQIQPRFSATGKHSAMGKPLNNSLSLQADTFQTRTAPSKIQFSGGPASSKKTGNSFSPITTAQRQQIVEALLAAEEGGYSVQKNKIASDAETTSYTVSEIQKQLKFFSKEDVIARRVKPTEEHVQAVLEQLQANKRPEDIHKDSPFTLREVKKLKENPDAAIRGQSGSRESVNYQQSLEHCASLISQALQQSLKGRLRHAQVTLPYDAISKETNLSPNQIYDQYLRMKQIIEAQGRTDFPRVLPPQA